MKRGFEQFRVRKVWCEATEMKAKGEKRQELRGSQCNIKIADCVAEIEPNVHSCVWFNWFTVLALFGVYAGIIRCFLESLGPQIQS